jgi:hypothetical protein
MICPVVVARNRLKPFTHAFWPLGILRGCYPNAVVNGFFCLYGIPQGGIANGLHGLNPRNTAHGHTPVQKATSVGLATGKSQVHGGTRLVDKVNKLVKRTWGFLIYSSSLERVG